MAVMCGGSPPRASSTAQKTASGVAGRGEVDAGARRPERRRSLAQRLAHRERQHQRRLADRLGAVDRAVLVGALEQRAR